MRMNDAVLVLVVDLVSAQGHDEYFCTLVESLEPVVTVVGSPYRYCRCSSSHETALIACFGTHETNRISKDVRKKRCGVYDKSGTPSTFTPGQSFAHATKLWCLYDHP